MTYTQPPPYTPAGWDGRDTWDVDETENYTYFIILFPVHSSATLIMEDIYFHHPTQKFVIRQGVKITKDHPYFFSDTFKFSNKIEIQQHPHPITELT